MYVSRIRHVLGPAARRLTSSATGYRLAVADDELDAARFERGLRLAREALAAGSSETSLATLEAIIGLWSGPALGDLAGEQFARREADRLEELRLQALEELFELRIGAGRAGAIGDLRRLVCDQPGRERLWRLLMLALYADGRQGEALEAYQDARRYLAEELGLDPSPELQDLERAILTQEAPRPEPWRCDRRLPRGSGRGRAVVRRTRRVVTVYAPTSFDRLRMGSIPNSSRRSSGVPWMSFAARSSATAARSTGPTRKAVTAMFGLTAAREDDALRAVRAAMELRGDRRVNRFRVGVATGEVLAGPHVRRVRGHRRPLQLAARLAARATPREVLLAPETERVGPCS